MHADRTSAMGQKQTPALTRKWSVVWGRADLTATNVRCTLESGRISAWCRTSLPSQTRTRRKPPDQEIFQSTVSSKTPRGKYFSSHRPRHSKCFGRRLRRSVMVASVISAAVSWGCACQSSWGSEPSWILPSFLYWVSHQETFSTVYPGYGKHTFSVNPPTSALGHKQTFFDCRANVCFRG